MQINTELKKLQQMRRSLFLKQLSSLRMLLRQGLAIRGHDAFDGNLEQLFQLRSEDDKDVKIWLQNSEYLSHDIVNECILLLGNTLLMQLLCSIRETSIFSIMADETRDISNQEQLSVCIRWIDSGFTIHEDLIGMVHVEKTDATSISSAIKDVLVRCSLPISQRRGQGYDGCSVMMGLLTGVATQLRQIEPTALQVHCFAHSLNFAYKMQQNYV